jgi:phage tail-like protein
VPTPLDTVTPGAGGGAESHSTYETGSPDVAYAFVIQIDSTKYGMFSEIGGISWKAEPIPIRSGGNNEYSYNLRGPGKFEPLTLKRGWFASSGEFYNLLRLGLQGVAVPAGAAGRFKLTINCLDRKYQTIGHYDFFNCFFVEYTGPGFNSMSGQVGFEQIRVAYDYFTYTAGNG